MYFVTPILFFYKSLDTFFTRPNQNNIVFRSECLSKWLKQILLVIANHHNLLIFRWACWLTQSTSAIETSVMKTIKFLAKLFDTEKKQSARMKSDNKIALEIISNLNRQLNQKSDELQEKITRNSECLAPQWRASSQSKYRLRCHIWTTTKTSV